MTSEERIMVLERKLTVTKWCMIAGFAIVCLLLAKDQVRPAIAQNRNIMRCDMLVAKRIIVENEEGTIGIAMHARDYPNISFHEPSAIESENENPRMWLHLYDEGGALTFYDDNQVAVQNISVTQNSPSILLSDEVGRHRLALMHLKEVGSLFTIYDENEESRVMAGYHIDEAKPSIGVFDEDGFAGAEACLQIARGNPQISISDKNSVRSAMLLDGDDATFGIFNKLGIPQAVIQSDENEPLFFLNDSEGEVIWSVK